MDCGKIVYTGHAFRQMFERQISIVEVAKVLEGGEVIADYPDDKPFPSVLVFAYIDRRPIHVVAAYDQMSGTCHIVTAYEPARDHWESDFKSRKPR